MAARLPIATLWQLLALSSAAFAAQRPVEFRDIIEMREPASPRISPDGRKLAYTLRQSSLDKDSSRNSLWVVSPGAQPRLLLEEAPIGPPVWLPKSDGLIARLPRPGTKAFWRIAFDGGTPQPLFEHPQPVVVAWWSPDASAVLFTSAEVETEEERRRREREGVVYDETVHGIRNFTRNTWAVSRSPSLWLWRDGQARAEKLSIDLVKLGTLRSARWAPSRRSRFDRIHAAEARQRKHITFGSARWLEEGCGAGNPAARYRRRRHTRRMLAA